MLERFVLLLARIAVGDVKLDAPAHILDGGEARLAHHAFQHHAAGDFHDHRRSRPAFRWSRLIVLLDARSDDKSSRRKSLGKALPVSRSALQLGAALCDDLVFVVHAVVRFVRPFVCKCHSLLIGYPYTPCFRLA